jgi:hypothetical protein
VTLAMTAGMTTTTADGNGLGCERLASDGGTVAPAPVTGRDGTTTGRARANATTRPIARDGQGDRRRDRAGVSAPGRGTTMMTTIASRPGTTRPAAGGRTIDERTGEGCGFDATTASGRANATPDRETRRAPKTTKGRRANADPLVCLAARDVTVSVEEGPGSSQVS